MGDGDFGYNEDEEVDTREGRYPLGNGLWTHPETGGDFSYSNPADNK